MFYPGDEVTSNSEADDTLIQIFVQWYVRYFFKNLLYFSEFLGI